MRYQLLHYHRVFIIGVFIVSMAAAGCGRGSLSTVSGTVTFEGAPVTSGSVILYCEDQQIVHGLIGPDGSYSIPNVPRGKARATVRAHSPLPDGFRLRTQLPPTIDGPRVPGEEPLGKHATPPIPKRYEMPEESGLAVQVSQADQVFDIRLNR